MTNRDTILSMIADADKMIEQVEQIKKKLVKVLYKEDFEQEKATS